MGEVSGIGPRGSNLSAPVPISTEQDFSAFDCGEPALHDWLRRRALKNESRFSRTYVVCAGNRVVAFYSLSAGAVERKQVLAKVRRHAPDRVPVAIIGRLAVDGAFVGQGFGADILADALRRVAGASQSIGIAAILVQAKSEAAKLFYLQHAEFIEFPASSRLLYLPIATLLAAM